MYAITGLEGAQMTELVCRLREAGVWGPACPFRLDLDRAVTVVLVYLRRNLAQAAIGEMFGISQPTVSRLIAALEGPIEQVLAGHVPTLEGLGAHAEQLVLFVDGTLIPCWSFQGHRELYSGKHHTTGHNHQVACDANGRLEWISDPLPGSVHDKAAFDHHHIADHLDSTRIVADKGYQGTGVISPTKKPKNGELTRADHRHNTSIHEIRWRIEQAIANIKTWRIFHTDYRRPLHTYTQAFRTTRALIFFKQAYE